MDEQTRERLRLGAERFVAADGPERVTIQDLYGDGWSIVENPGIVGKEFCKMVKAGKIPGLQALEKRDWLNQRNHAEYMRVA